MSKLKTLKDFIEADEEEVKNLSSGNYEGLKYFQGRLDLFNELKAEAINRISNCCPNDNIGGTPLRKDERCEACKRDIWFNNLTMEDLK